MDPKPDKKGEITTQIQYRLIEEIAARKQTEEILQESEERFRSLYENSTIGLYRTTPDGRILLANPTLVQMLGYSSFEELSVRNLEKEGFEVGCSRSEFIKRVEREGKIIGFESAWRKRNGSVIFIRESARVIQADDGSILYYEGTVEDITERKHAEEALKVSEKKYRDVVENATDFIFMNNIFGNFTFVNTVAERMTEYSKDELIGMNYAKVTHPDDIEKTRKLYEEQFKTRNKEIKFENRFVTKSGKIRWLWVHAILNMDGDYIVDWQNIGRDITERKRMEDELKKKIEQLDRANKLMVGRELKMIELKREINTLLERAGQPKKYITPDDVK